MFQDPVKNVMLVLLLAMEIPSAIILVVEWKRACKEAKESKGDNDN